ncbi:MAG: Hsp20/alpha crystallin family protein [Candidatus Woesebacteria bacterium]|nr:MAG: Hsp20/alpha crystallin family protein [Candidatus Woesebacteria bacterium]
MQIVKFNPFSPFINDRFFSTFDDDESWPTIKTNDGLDVYETDSDVVVKAAVPGIPSDKVEVTFEDGVLRISAKSEETKEEKDKKKVVYRQQRASYFDYTTTLPRAVEGNKISAEVSDGVVTVKAPIAQEAKPKRIAVKARAK